MLLNTQFIVVNGHPQVKFEFDNLMGFCKPWTMNKRSIKAKGNILQIPYGSFWEFVDCNKDIIGDVFEMPLSKDSVDCFYGYCLDSYEDKWVYSARLTKNFLEKWLDYDCPQLVRYEPNKGKSVNALGMKMPVFETTLYEWGYGGAEAADDITKEEMECFEKYLPNTSYCYENIKEAYEIANTDYNVEEISDTVLDYERTIQNDINKHKTEIKAYMETLPERQLDCGFAWIVTYNKEMLHLLDVLKTKEARSSNDLKVDFPTDYFSTINSRLGFEKFLELEPKYKEELSMITRLD